jgi:SIR2-like domain
VLDGPDDVIITEDDYVDFMVNSGGKISPFFPPTSLLAAYKKRRFLFLGYSLYDWNFRAFLRMLTIRNALSGSEARRHYAIQLNPEPIEVELWKQRNVNVYHGDLTKFCKRIIRSLEGTQ